MNDQGNRMARTFKVMAIPATLFAWVGGQVLQPGRWFRFREWLSYKIAPPIPLGVWMMIKVTSDGKLRIQLEPEKAPEPEIHYDDLPDSREYDYPLDSHE